MIGKKILNYEITSLIGEGGMGNVYLAKHTKLDRVVAIKSILPELVNNDEIKKRFLNEATSMTTYTIESLSFGDAFIANGLIVGTEKIKR